MQIYKNYTFRYQILAISILLACVMSSCNVNKYLKKDDYLLRSSKIELVDPQNISKPGLVKMDLINAIKQTPNKKWKLNLYFKNLYSDDSASFIMKTRDKFSEQPVYYNSQTNQSNADILNNVMKKKGYFSSKVRIEEGVDSAAKRGFVSYFIEAGSLYKIKSIDYDTHGDTSIGQIMEDHKKEAYLKPGIPVDQNIYLQEKARITLLLQNNGYAKFNNSYIPPLLGDTLPDKTVDVTLEILNARENIFHQKYKIGRVSILTDYDPSNTGRKPVIDTLIDGYRFVSYSPKFSVRPEVLARSIYFKKDEWYSVQKFDRTLKRVARLGLYKFQAFRDQPSKTDSSIIDYYLLLTPTKKFTAGYDFELSNSSLSGTGQSFLGIFGGISFRNKNLFKGAEQMTTNLSGGVEFNLQGESLFRSQEIKLTNDVLIPKYMDLNGTMSLLKSVKFGKKRLINRDFYTSLKENANTLVGFGADFVNLSQYYSYFSLNTNYGWDLLLSEQKRVQSNMIGFNYFSPKTQLRFDSILQNNVVLKNSFGNQLFTGIFFKDLRYTVNTLPNTANESYYFRTDVEVSGLEILAANYLFNQFRDTFKIGDIEFSQFVKLELDGRYYKQYNPKTQLVLRANIGIAVPLGTSENVPYIKQFYQGGPLSMRAWKIRELGPGSYFDKNAQGAPYYQSGDLKLELNAEYRFDLFWRLKGALFTDIGNIWSIPYYGSDPREGASFSIKNAKFITDLAVGAGFGIRLDFSYFVIRADIGSKVKTPYKIDNRYYPYQNFGEAIRDLNFNIAINYPF